MSQVIKQGFMQRYSRKFMQEGWKNHWCVLYSDGTLIWYKQQGDRTPKGQVNMKSIANYFAVGVYAARIPNAPRVADGTVPLLLALPDRPSKDAFVEFFVAHSQQDLNDWMEKIVSVLPPHPQQNGPVPAGPPAYPSAHAAAAAPYPNVGFAPMPQPAPYPTQQPYPTQAGYAAPPAYYPQQGCYPQQAPYLQQAPNPQPGAYPQPQYYYPPGATQPTHQIVYVNGKPKKKKILGMKTNTAAGLVGGAAAGYMLGRMTGGFHPWGHPFGLGGGWGSWSSLSSFGSGGSWGSCGSFGSFD